jgi:hypothetical protein
MYAKTNLLIKIKMFVVSCVLFFGDTLTSTNMSLFKSHVRVHLSTDHAISGEPTKSLGIKTQYTPSVVFRLVNIFNCLAYDWAVKDESMINFN